MSRRIPISIAAAVLTLAFVGGARASGDSCEPGWSLDFSSKPQCQNISVLVPGNDTRANLMLLLADRHGVKPSGDPAPRPTLDWPEFRDLMAGIKPDATSPDYASGEGSRCLSNDAGDKAFSTAVAAAAGLTQDERTALTEARAGLKPSCAGADAASTKTPDNTLPVPRLATPQGRAFGAYLRSTAAFYAGRFDEAASGFAGLETATDPWLAETASYMVARTAINRMQDGAFDEYGTFKGAESVDQTRAQEAEAGLDAYLRTYPKGRYADSARGLRRRVAWLAGWTDKLLSQYVALIAQPPGTRGITDAALADEIDNKLQPALKPEVTRDPTLLAVLDLMSLRKETKGTPQPPRPNLASQRDAFSANPDLYAYLEAAFAYYGDANPGAVIKMIPDDAKRRGGDHLWFSRQFLRGLALEAVGDRNARGFWKELIPAAMRPLERSAAELALALNEERRKDIEDAFAPGTPLTNAGIRAMLLINDAGEDLLRVRANDEGATERERQIALFTLLRKKLTHGSYTGFQADLAMVSPNAPKEGSVVIDPLGTEAVPLGVFKGGQTNGDIPCPSLMASVAGLIRNQEDSRSKLCVAEWMRLNNFDPDRYANVTAKGSLGYGPSSFAGKERTRDVIYSEIIADRGTPPEDRAYALYRAVKCYEPSGSNACGRTDVPKSERRRWHEALKREFPGSRWAKEIRYWW